MLYCKTVGVDTLKCMRFNNVNHCKHEAHDRTRVVGLLLYNSNHNRKQNKIPCIQSFRPYTKCYTLTSSARIAAWYLVDDICLCVWVCQWQKGSGTCLLVTLLSSSYHDSIPIATTCYTYAYICIYTLLFVADMNTSMHMAAIIPGGGFISMIRRLIRSMRSVTGRQQ